MESIKVNTLEQAIKSQMLLKEFAKELNITEFGLRYKLDNNTFTAKELPKISKLLGLTYEQIINLLK